MKKQIAKQAKITSTNTLKTLSDFPKPIYPKPHSNLDWSTIVSNKGETRAEHILRHTILIVIVNLTVFLMEILSPW